MADAPKDKVVDLAERRLRLVEATEALAAEPDPLLLAHVAELQRKVAAGEIYALSLVAISPDGDISTGYFWEDSLARAALLGGMVTAVQEAVAQD